MQLAWTLFLAEEKQLSLTRRTRKWHKTFPGPFPLYFRCSFSALLVHISLSSEETVFALFRHWENSEAVTVDEVSFGARVRGRRSHFVNDLSIIYLVEFWRKIFLSDSEFDKNNTVFEIIRKTGHCQKGTHDSVNQNHSSCFSVTHCLVEPGKAHASYSSIIRRTKYTNRLFWLEMYCINKKIR